MTITVPNHHCKWSIGCREHCAKGRLKKHIQFLGWSSSQFTSRGSYIFHGHPAINSYHQSPKRFRPIFSSTLDDGTEPDDSRDESRDETEKVNSDMLKENLEKIVGVDDSAFNGSDLATLIRKKYGRSYDVQLIKQEFMGRNFLALNVMWKYREQRSFPLTEEEYILRLDDVANTLRCWGAVSHIRSSLEKLKERPRIGKAVSIFIDMDQSGGRANEWIYK